MRLKLLLLICVISQFCRAQADLNLGLQAYYPFSGNANDVSGNNNNPVFNNASLTDDRFGNVKSAYNFNGSDNYMRIPNAATLNPGTKISMCAWVKPKGFYLGLCHGNSIIDKGYMDQEGGFYALRFSDGQYTNGQNCVNSTVDQTHQNFDGLAAAIPNGYTPFIETNKWYSVVTTYDGTTANLYVNCELISSTNIARGPFGNNKELFLGRHYDIQGIFPYWLNGDMDEIRIYNRALNADEVKLYGDCSIAPVTLKSFTATSFDNRSATLNWNVTQETNIKDYTIERAVTGVSDFTPIGNVSAINDVIEKKYSFYDNDLLSDTYYYRIVITEKNGNRKYSEIRKVVIINKGFNANVYPNTSNGSFTVRTNKETADIVVVNVTGQTVLSQKIKNSMTAPLNISSQPNGIYWIKIISDNEIITKRIVKL